MSTDSVSSDRSPSQDQPAAAQAQVASLAQPRPAPPPHDPECKVEMFHKSYYKKNSCPGFTFRLLEESDLPRVIESIQLWSEEDATLRPATRIYSADYFLSRLQNKSAEGFIAQDQKDLTVAGFIFFEITPDNLLVFTHYFVRKEYRRQGIATILSDFAIMRAKTREPWPFAARLTVSTSNTNAIRIYEKYSMSRIKIITNFFGSGQDAYMYQYIHDQEGYDSRKKPKGDIPAAIRLGLFSAVGINIDWIKDENNTTNDDSKENAAHQSLPAPTAIPAKTASSQKKIVWLPDVEESWGLLSPDQAGELMDRGYSITVERSGSRGFDDGAYAMEGCALVPSGTWKYSPVGAVVVLPVGAKERDGADEARYAFVASVEEILGQ